MERIQVIKYIKGIAIHYITNYIMPKIKEAFEKAKEKFVEILWNEVKEDMELHIKSAIEYIQKFFRSAEYEVKEQVAIDTLFNRVKLPILLKPFKSLLKKTFKKKLKKLISEGLNNLESKA